MPYYIHTTKHILTYSPHRTLFVSLCAFLYALFQSPYSFLQAMKDKMGNSEAERRSSFYDQTWCHEAVPRYFYAKVGLHSDSKYLCTYCGLAKNLCFFCVCFLLPHILSSFTYIRSVNAELNWSKLWAFITHS